VSSLVSPNHIVAGDFQFDKKMNVFTVARMLTRGNFGGTQAKITIPEGSSNVEIAKIISKLIPNF
jgi:cell division protein YceG involved in septum cleavage